MLSSDAQHAKSSVPSFLCRFLHCADVPSGMFSIPILTSVASVVDKEVSVQLQPGINNLLGRSTPLATPSPTPESAEATASLDAIYGDYGATYFCITSPNYSENYAPDGSCVIKLAYLLTLVVKNFGLRCCGTRWW